MKKQLNHFNKEIIAHQIKLAKQNEEEFGEHDYLWYDRVTYTEFNGLYDINYYTGDYGFQSTPKEDLEHPETSNFIDEDGYLDGYEYGLDWFIDILIKNAEKIGGLAFLNPHNCGYNGLANWDLVRLVEADVVFSKLISLKVQLYDIGDHNISYIGEVDGNKQVTQLLAKCPNIVSIELPTTPDQDFFKMKFPKLSYMKVQGNIDSRYFIKNLSNSPLLSQMTVDFMDCLLDDDLLDMSKEDRALLEDYKEEQCRFTERLQQEEVEIANSDNPRETRQKFDRIRLKENGFSDEEIALQIDRPNREETLRLLRITEDSEREVKELMDYYDQTDRWLENGEYDWDNDYDEKARARHDDDEESETHNLKTAFEDYKTLMQSKYIPENWHFTLREGYLSQEQLKELNTLNSNIQFLYVPTKECYYLSHKF